MHIISSNNNMDFNSGTYKLNHTPTAQKREGGWGNGTPSLWTFVSLRHSALHVMHSPLNVQRLSSLKASYLRPVLNPSSATISIMKFYAYQN